ncbi:MAG: hypothetical protein QOD07_3034 [Frankiaceae bacterium]|nr:hypothetical protein [Frankiaceae bacterium]
MTSSTADRDTARLDDDGAPVSTPRQPAAPDARLVWAPDGTPPTGTWWPKTRDAATELRALLPQVSDRLGGTVTRVSLNIGAWNADQPRRLRVGDSLVRLGWFNTLDSATVTLGRSGAARVTLHVVAPELDPDAARELLREASRSNA